MAADFRAICATHTQHHNKSPKDHIEWARINAKAPWKDQELTPLELADWISSGKAWTACHLGGRSHSEDNVVASNLIVLDIDGDLTLEAFWAIPAVQRHCLFTATSCSHRDEEHRFRAVFVCELHEEVDLHGAIYDIWLDRLGLQLKDDGGRKPERLWYGNDKAIIQFGGGEPIPWDLIEQARDNLKAARDARPRVPSQSNPDDLALDLRRAVFCFEKLLRPSVDGDFSGGYWKELLLAAAATGDENVQQAFLEWHHRGHHSKTQTQVKRRLQRSRSRMTPGEGAGKILKAAKAQHGEQWWKLLPQELQYGSSRGTFKAPTVLMRSRSESDVAPFSTIWTPDIAPTTSDLEHAEGPSVKPPTILGRARSFSDIAPQNQPLATAPLAKTPRSVSLLASRGSSDTPSPANTSRTQTSSESEQIEQLLLQLYAVETGRKLLTSDGERQLTAKEARYKIDQLESELQAFPAFRGNPQRIRTRLLEIFCDHNGISQRSEDELELEPLLSGKDSPNEYLIDGLMVRGASYLIYSLPGIGKTTLALLLARAALGTPGQDQFLGFKATPSEPFSQSRVIYIASDGRLFAKGDLNTYLQKLGQEGEEWPKYMPTYSAHRNNRALPWKMNVRGLHKLVTDLDRMEAAGTPVRLLVIDSLKACMPDGVLIGDQVLAHYLEVIEGICGPRDITTVYLTHQSKDSENPQGIAALTEMVHGYFRIRVEGDQHYFCINKLRSGRISRRDLPYKVSPSGDLIICDCQEQSEEDNADRMLVRVFAEHYAKHLRITDHLDQGDTQRFYRGVQRSDVPILLRERGLSHPALRNSKCIDRVLHKLVKSGRLKKVEHGRYAIAHANDQDLIEQADLDFDQDKRGKAGLDDPDRVHGWD